MQDIKIPKELKDEELSKITGGANKTGDTNNEGKVYFSFPWPASFFSGFYDKKGLEDLCQMAINNGLTDSIKPQITQDIRDAVNKLYGTDPIPAPVQTLLG